MELSSKTKGDYVLAFETDKSYKAIRIPESKVQAVDQTLTKGKSIKVGGKFLELEKIVGIFPANEWANLKSSLLEEPDSEYMRFKKDMEQFKATGKHPRSKRNEM